MPLDFNEAEEPELGYGAGSALPWSLLVCCCVAVAVSTLMSITSICLHLKNYRKPYLQRMVVRILIMVPIYGISSLVAIFSLNLAFIIDVVRDIYEAFVIYCFFQLLLAYLGGERSLLILLQGRPPTVPIIPLNWFWHEIDVSDPHTFLFLKRGILQYVQIKPLLAIATLILKALGVYNDGDFKAKSGYLYVTIIYNFSICLSLYCLAMFWACVHKDLLPFRPMPKFLCIKGIIFFSFWQSAFISVLVAAEAIPKLGPYEDRELISQALNDTLLCFEMMLFAFGHQYAFSQKDYQDPHVIFVARMPFGYAFRDAFGMRDVWEDTKMTLAGEGMDYREFEPAEALMHQGSGRERRIKAGLRYTKGGKQKYWLPQPAPQADPNSVANRIGRKLKRGDSEEVYAPLLNEQVEGVVRDDVDSSDDEFPSAGPSDGLSLYFHTPNNSEEQLFSNSRHYLFGDYNYPNVDVSAESARREIWDEEERILSNARGAYFSPRHQQRKLYFAQQEYGAASDGPRSRGQSDASMTKGKRRKEELGNDDSLIVNRDDDRLPDLYTDGVKLKWTRHGNLKPSASPGTHRHSVSPAARQGRRRSSPDDGDSSSATGSYVATNSTGSSPAGGRERAISRPDAVDLVVEDPQAAEASQARERKRGEPAVRGSGLRRVYRQEYHIEDERGHQKEVDVEQLRKPDEDQRNAKIPDETRVKVTSDSGDEKETTTTRGLRGIFQEPRAEEVTEVEISREESPPPTAKIHIEHHVEDSNPWA